MSPRIFFNTIRLRSKNIFFHGAILAFYVIAVITTFALGIYGFIRMAEVDFSKTGGAPAPVKSLAPLHLNFRHLDLVPTNSSLTNISIGIPTSGTNNLTNTS
jgi:hypothetical protein